MVMQEMIHEARIIPTDGRPHSKIRQWHGSSRGHWEGDTLVVETINFTDKTNFRGAGENLKLVERFSRTDADTLTVPRDHRGSDDVHEAVDRADADDEERRGRVRVRVPRRQPRPRGDPERVAAAGQAERDRNDAGPAITYVGSAFRRTSRRPAVVSAFRRTPGPAKAGRYSSIDTTKRPARISAITASNDFRSGGPPGSATFPTDAAGLIAFQSPPS